MEDGHASRLVMGKQKLYGTATFISAAEAQYSPLEVGSDTGDGAQHAFGFELDGPKASERNRAKRAPRQEREREREKGCLGSARREVGSAEVGEVARFGEICQDLDWWG